MYISHMAAAGAEGSCFAGWSLQCDHRVLTAPRVLVQSKATLLQGPGTGSTWHKSCDSPHMPAAHSLLLQACSGCSMGRVRAAQHTLVWSNLDTAVPGCPGTLRMLYVGAKVMLYSPATASAAASCSLVCDCYRVLTTARVVRAELTSTTRTKVRRFGHAAHT
jgi:hypothetical protein